YWTRQDAHDRRNVPPCKRRCAGIRRVEDSAFARHREWRERQRPTRWVAGLDRGRSGEKIVTRDNAVWITGVGAATPLGHDYAAFADLLLAGTSGVRAVSSFDVSEHPSQIAGLLPHKIPCPAGYDEADFGELHALEQLMLWCCGQALR